MPSTETSVGEAVSFPYKIVPIPLWPRWRSPTRPWRRRRSGRCCCCSCGCGRRGSRSCGRRSRCSCSCGRRGSGCCRRRCRCSATRAGVSARARGWRPGIAEVLRKGVVRSLHTRDIQLVAAGLDGAEDEVKPLVGIILVQARLKIRSLRVIGEIHCAPFNVEDAIRRSARHRSKDTASGCEGCTTLAHYVGAIVRPEREDRVVIGALIGRSWQTSRKVAHWFVDEHEV